MPVLMECINVFVLYKKLIKVFPGGEPALNEACLSGGIWHDGFLVRFGAMNEFDMELIVGDLKNWGLKPGKDFGFDEPWIEHSPDGFSAPCVALKGELNAPLVGPHNINDFLGGKVKPLRRRATVIIQHDEKVLLVRDRGKKSYSLPGGKVERKEQPLCAAIRELYEELSMRAVKVERCPQADYNAAYNSHIVCVIESDDQPLINRRELDDYLWWDRKKEIARYRHVDQILSALCNNPPHSP